MHPVVTPTPTLRDSLRASIPIVRALHNFSLKICVSQENEPARHGVDDNNGNAKVGSIVSASDLD